MNYPDTPEQAIRKEILDMAFDKLIELVSDLRNKNDELKERVSDLETELEEAKDEFYDLEEKYEGEYNQCDECIVPNCKSMALATELEAVINDFKMKNKLGISNA